MKTILVLVLLLTCNMLIAKDKCKYSNGKCADSNNKECLNPVNVSELFKDFNEEQNAYNGIDAECVDFRDFNFNNYIGMDYKKLTDWNLRGANLTNAKFHFANMVGCDLRGADFEKLSFGYTEITGSVDDYSRVPKENCKVTSGKVKCRQ